jgi:H/ACA ribonucleoprotein complex subunit 2
VSRKVRRGFCSTYLQGRIRRLTFYCPTAAAHRTLKRGVKEVVKALRKSTSSSTTSSSPIGVVILAADISPMDVISHIPVLCEDHNIPYVYVTSRAELGMAGQTKRPTSVVMVVGAAGKKKGKDGKEVDGDGDTAEWDEVFKGLVKTVEREGRHVKV